MASEIAVESYLAGSFAVLVLADGTANLIDKDGEIALPCRDKYEANFYAEILAQYPELLAHQ